MCEVNELRVLKPARYTYSPLFTKAEQSYFSIQCRYYDVSMLHRNTEPCKKLRKLSQHKNALEVGRA